MPSFLHLLQEDLNTSLKFQEKGPVQCQILFSRQFLSEFSSFLCQTIFEQHCLMFFLGELALNRCYDVVIVDVYYNQGFVVT